MSRVGKGSIKAARNCIETQEKSIWQGKMTKPLHIDIIFKVNLCKFILSFKIEKA